MMAQPTTLPHCSPTSGLILIFRYERLPANRGKSWAMAHGVDIASKDIILFVDADVSNLRKEHFDSLLGPFGNGK